MESNKLIAEFMGYTHQSDSEFKDENGFWNDFEVFETWNWLMPVLKKINGQMHFNTRGLWRMITIPYDYHIEDVHNQVVEFIIQYNDEQDKA